MSNVKYMVWMECFEEPSLADVIRAWSVVSKIEHNFFTFQAYILSEVEWRVQGLRPRSRTQKKSKANDSPSEDKPSRGQGPTTQVLVFSKKKGLEKNLSGKKGLKKIFFGISPIEEKKRSFGF